MHHSTNRIARQDIALPFSARKAGRISRMQPAVMHGGHAKSHTGTAVPHTKFEAKGDRLSLRVRSISFQVSATMSWSVAGRDLDVTRCLAVCLRSRDRTRK